MIGPRPASAERSDAALAAWTAWGELPVVLASAASLVSYLFVFLAYDWRPFELGAVALDLAGWLTFAYVLGMQLRVAPDRRALLRQRKVLALVVLSGPIAVAFAAFGFEPGIVLALRLLRVIPLGRWFLRKRSLAYPIAFGAIMLLIAAYGFSRIEHHSLGDSLFWSAATVTIGPQGLQATHRSTEVLTILLGFLGLGFFGAVVGSLTVAVMRASPPRSPRSPPGSTRSSAACRRRRDAGPPRNGRSAV